MGKYDNTNENYFIAATTTSQNINLIRLLMVVKWKKLPLTAITIAISEASSAPNDMYMALGKNDQKIYVIPSRIW
jgi:hypothetical protein